MEPAITIIAYLWDSRNTWFKHHEECVCPFSELLADQLDALHVTSYLDITETSEGALITFKHLTTQEWNCLVGPEARRRVLNEQAEAHMNTASEILALLATEERLGSDE